jgi:hypothetical protein
VALAERDTQKETERKRERHTRTHTHTAKTVGKILLGFSQALNVMNLPNISTLEHFGLRPVVASSPSPADPLGVAGRIEDQSPEAIEEDAKGKGRGILRTKFGAPVSPCVKCASVKCASVHSV